MSWIIYNIWQDTIQPSPCKIVDELKVMGIGCSNLWDMRILQDFFFFFFKLFHLKYENDGEPEK